MTSIHKNLPDNQRHEPKGASTAASDSVYVSDGAGSGVWKKVPVSSLSGLSGDGAVADKFVASNGSGGFKLLSPYSVGVMGITNNSANFAVSAAADATLQTSSDYVLFTGAGAPWAGEISDDVAFSTNKLTVTYPGLYEVRFWGNISGYPSNTAFVGAKFKINGTTWSTRTVVAKSNSAGDAGQLSAFGLVQLAANDYVQLFVASSVTGNLVVKNANMTVELKRSA